MKKHIKKYMVAMLLFVSAFVITSCSNQGVPKAESTPVEKVGQDAEENPRTENPSAGEVSPDEIEREVGIYPDMQVPDFTLLDGHNNEVSLSDYRGKIVFLNFWATTCKYCIEEMPDLEKFYNAHKGEDDFALLGINMTKTWEKKSKDKLVEWLDGEGLTFPVVFDEDGAVAEEWMAQSLPVTFIITEEGVSLGAIMGKTDIDTLEGILAEVRGE